MILFVVFMALISGLLLASASVLQTRLSAAGQNRLAALTLAEAGVDDAVDRLRQDVGFAGAADTLYQDPPANVRPFGTFATVVSDAGANTKKVVSTGTCPNGSTRQVVALVDVTPRPAGLRRGRFQRQREDGRHRAVRDNPAAEPAHRRHHQQPGHLDGRRQLRGRAVVRGRHRHRHRLLSVDQRRRDVPLPDGGGDNRPAERLPRSGEDRRHAGGINNAGSNMALTAPSTSTATSPSRTATP
jgi:hypothetical protein